MKNKKKIFIIILMIFMLCGCTKVLKDENNKVVVSPTTGQNVTENILCKPTSEEMLKIYEENKVDISKLPDCKDMKVTGKYESIWNSIFVRPLAWLIVKLGEVVNSTGLAIILITIGIRILLFPVTQKTAMQSENMKKAQPDPCWKELCTSPAQGISKYNCTGK